ncbi:MAG: RluA family pseudouridine synthase [Pseudomonadota bacterium]
MADRVELEIPASGDGMRLDKALALAARDGSGLSRSRLAQLIDAGAITDAVGRTVTDHKRKVKAGEGFTLILPPATPAEPQAEAIPLSVVFEDADLIVVDKPAGMVVHPAPGAETGTLVNALLHHCGDNLAGIGGVLRPGIVHRIDKETSGLLVAAKTQTAHAGLAALFATHDIERSYRALAWGVPDRADPRLASRTGVAFEGGWLKIETLIARDPRDRKRMAVAARDGRNAVTRMRSLERFGPDRTPVASLLECRLETGRTHQIRVHATHIGHPLIGDPVYGRRRTLSARTVSEATRSALTAFPRQALHAATLGFRHPITGETHRFDAPFPADFCTLLADLRRITAPHS